MNVNDLPFPEAGGSCTFRLPDTLHYDDAPYIRYIPAGTELTLVTHDDGSREPAKPEKVTRGESQGYHYFSNKAQAHAASRENGKPYSEIDEIEVQISKSGILSALNIYGGHPRQRMKTISVIDVLLLIVVAPWIAIMAVPVLPVITLLSVINLCRHLSVRAVWQHIDQPKREAHAVGLILPVPAHPVRRDLPSALRQFAFHMPRAARLDEQALAITAAI